TRSSFGHFRAAGGCHGREPTEYIGRTKFLSSHTAAQRLTLHRISARTARMGPVSRIYFDHNATTPVAGACVDAMAAVLREDFGNPSSVHYFGQRAKARMDDARTAVARLLNAD